MKTEIIIKLEEERGKWVKELYSAAQASEVENVIPYHQITYIEGAIDSVSRCIEIVKKCHNEND